MLVDLKLEHVLVAAPVVWPDVNLADAHAVERAFGQPIEAVGQLLGIGEGAANALDDALAPAGIDGNAAVARRIGAGDAHLVARSEFRVDDLAHGLLLSLSLISAARESTSARVSTPFSCIRLMK